MTKQEYIVEMLSEILGHYQITPEVLQQCAEDVVDGLDVWYELSGDSVATSNRYQHLEDEVVQVKKATEKELEKAEKKHKEEVDQMIRETRWRYQRYQEKIDELQKQVK